MCCVPRHTDVIKKEDLSDHRVLECLWTTITNSCIDQWHTKWRTCTYTQWCEMVNDGGVRFILMKFKIYKWSGLTTTTKHSLVTYCVFSTQLSTSSVDSEAGLANLQILILTCWNEYFYQHIGAQEKCNLGQHNFNRPELTLILHNSLISVSVVGFPHSLPSRLK